MSKKSLIAIAILAVVVVSIGVLFVVPQRSDVAGGDSVAVIQLSGPIQSGGSGSLFGGAITPELVRDRLEGAQRSAAVVLQVTSPGGTVAASQEIAAMVRDFRKPVVVSMGDVAASGGYYVASQADVVVAHPGSLTGSIGVIWSTFDPAGLFRKLGVETEAITAGKHKDMFLPGRLTPERRRLLQGIVDSMYGQFVSAVAEGRDLSRQEVLRLATGEPYTGEQALEAGLVDRLGGLDEAVEEAERLAGIEDARVVEVAPSLFEELFSGGGFGGLRLPGGPAELQDNMLLIRELFSSYSVPRYGW